MGRSHMLQTHLSLLLFHDGLHIHRSLMEMMIMMKAPILNVYFLSQRIDRDSTSCSNNFGPRARLLNLTSLHYFHDINITSQMLINLSTASLNDFIDRYHMGHFNSVYSIDHRSWRCQQLTICIMNMHWIQPWSIVILVFYNMDNLL